MRHRSDMVAIFVIRLHPARGWQFLQLRRVADDYLGGTWQTVRGGIEPGETAPAAALRELREETGLVPAEFYRLGACEVFYIPSRDPAAETVWHCPSFCAVVPHDAEILLDEENDASRWIDEADVETAFMWASERVSLDDVRRSIIRNGPAKPYLKLQV
ncbi:MAG: NUDIX domain-containing protein [Phycisphaerae bacterium]